MNMFNNKGELNAGSVKEALQLINKLASVYQDGEPSGQALAGHVAVSDERANDMISRAILTNEGKVALAQAMANPIN